MTALSSLRAAAITVPLVFLPAAIAGVIDAPQNTVLPRTVQQPTVFTDAWACASGECTRGGTVVAHVGEARR